MLCPGGTVAILDFNNVQNPAVDAFQGFMLEQVGDGPSVCALLLLAALVGAGVARRGVRCARMAAHGQGPVQRSPGLQRHGTLPRPTGMQVVVPAARQLGVAEEYEYLRPSIKRFPPGGWSNGARHAGGCGLCCGRAASLPCPSCRKEQCQRRPDMPCPLPRRPARRA